MLQTLSWQEEIFFALSKILGHTSVEMTAKRYAALHPRFMENVANTIQFDSERGRE